MAGFLDILRGGNWLTQSRIRLWALAVLVTSAAGVVYLFATSDGLNDYQGRPLGTDFSNIYVAGTHVLEGHPQAPFDPQAQHARAKDLFGAGTSTYYWHYPPFFHLVAAPLALLPYLPALAVWQGVTLLLYLLSIRMIVANGCVRPQPPAGESDRQPTAELPGLWLLLALAFPAVFINLGHGHNGFLTASLIGCGLVFLDRRPIVAGILFGLLSYKPQFGLMIPLVLAVTGRWRTFLAAGTTVVALALGVIVLFGLDTWRAFFNSAAITRGVMEHGESGWHLVQSVFSAVRMWGGAIPLAYAAQGAITLCVAASLAWLWRSRADYPTKAAALCIGSILATPYSLDYDMMALAPAIAFLGAEGLRRGFAPYEKTALAALWAVPLVTRSIAQTTLVPLGVIAMLAMFALVIRRGRSQPDHAGHGIPAATG